MLSFNYITRKKHLDSLTVSENLTLVDNKIAGIEYWTIDNVFEDPEAAIHTLKNWPVLSPPESTYTPGGRQNFTPMDLVPLVTVYSQIANSLTGLDYEPWGFITSSNVVWKNPQVWENSWIPHTDHNLVFNLWLCNWTEGTGLYTYNGNKKGDMDLTKLNKNKIVTWKNMTNENGWLHYHTIPCKYNSLSIYDGKLYHSTIMGDGEGDRYSLHSFYHNKMRF